MTAIEIRPPALTNDIGTAAESSSKTGHFPSPLILKEESNLPDIDNLKSRRRARIHFITLCWCLFVTGWSDGTLGPLIPAIQNHYKVGYTVVSLSFVVFCVGVLLAAVLNVYMADKLGFGKLLVIGSLFSLIAFSIQASAPPFPVFVFANSLNGIGEAWQDAQANTFVAALSDGSMRMGIMHAVYGTGAFAAPLIATQFASLRHWNSHYLVTVGIGTLNALVLLGVFRLKSQEEIMIEGGEITHEKKAAGNAEKETQAVPGNKYKQIVKLRAARLLGIFAFLYCGAEITTGGWIVSFIIRERGGGPHSGYVSSGFFGGLALGRVCLIPLTAKIGRRRAIIIYSCLVVALEFVVWFLPSLIGDSVAVSVIGFLIGPIYPVMLLEAGSIVPPHLLTGVVGWITAASVLGAAVFPFATGALSSRFGLGSMPPLLLSVVVAMTSVWIYICYHYRYNGETPRDTAPVENLTQ